MSEAQERFGARLRMQREARELSIADVVKVTKIPERSLLLLESGAFKDLPAEVFVRGFLKSYCRCVGIDTDEILREYDELAAVSAGREPPTLTRPAPPRHRLPSDAHPPVGVAPVAAAPEPRAPISDSMPEPVAAEPAEAAAPAQPAEPPEPDEDAVERSLFDALARAGRSTRRAPLTVAVIILVIVATVTLSLLLRRPGHVPDHLNGGLSALPPSSSTTAPPMTSSLA